MACVSYDVLGGNTANYSVNLKQRSASCKGWERGGGGVSSKEKAIVEHQAKA